MSFENEENIFIPDYFPRFPDDWKLTTLDKIIEPERKISYGIVQPGSHCDDGVPIIRVNNLDSGHVIESEMLKVAKEIDEKYHRTRLCGGEVLLSLVGTLGRCAVVPKKMKGYNIARAIAVIPVSKRIEPEWVKYCLQTEFSQSFIRKYATTTVQATFNLGDVNKIIIPLPYANERIAITSVLKAIDDKIELNNRINKTLEEMAQAFFKRWFVDFEFPDENGQPYKASGGEMEESELGLIPKGWDIIAFDDFIVERKEKAGERDIPEYSSTNSGLFPRSEKFKKQLSVSQFSNKVIRKNDLVFGMSRQILNWGIMFEELGAVSAAYHVFEVNQALVDSHFLELLMKNRISYFADIIKPAAREGQGIDKSGLKKKTIYIPPIKIFEEFQRAIMSLQEAIKLKTTEIDNLTSLRDALLPKLMSGEIRVPIEEVAADV